MTVKSCPPSIENRWLGTVGRIVVCLCVTTWIFLSAADWKRGMEAAEARFLPEATGPAAAKPVFLDDDPYCWITNAEDAVRTGAWRVRHTAIDNVPFGREMHYSQAVTWMILFAGKIHALVTGESMLASVSHAAMWVNPALFSIFLGAIFWLLSIRLGWVPAGLATFWMAAHGDVWWAFHPYRPDHQTFHLMFSLLPVLLLSLGGFGWVRDGRRAEGRWIRGFSVPSEAVAKRFFLAAGIFQALDLWIGAIVQTVFLGLTVAGAAGIISCLSRHDRNLRPALWRRWSLAGAATALVMWLVEYFPHDLSWRLEVNHPLYALFWVAAGECLVLLATLRSQDRWPRPTEWARGAAWVAVGSVLPLVALVGGPAVHVMRDAEYNRVLSIIIEFQHYWNFTATPLWQDFPSNQWFLPLFLPLGAWLLLAKSGAAPERAVLAFALLLTVVLLALAFWQQRWFCFYAQFNIWLMVLCLSIGWKRMERSDARELVFVPAVIALIFAPFELLNRQTEKLRQLTEGRAIVDQVATPILIKRFSIRLGELLAGRDARVMADPALAAPLYYFGGLRTVGSFYWEDIAGLHDTVDFFAATNNDGALAVARRRGLTHIVLPERVGEPAEFLFFKTGQRGDDPPENLAAKLDAHSPTAPLWAHKSFELVELEGMKWQVGTVTAQNNIGVWEIDPAP